MKVVLQHAHSLNLLMSAINLNFTDFLRTSGLVSQVNRESCFCFTENAVADISRDRDDVEEANRKLHGN